MQIPASVTRRISRGLNKLRYAPIVQVDKSSTLLRFGSLYGGWTFLNSPDLNNSSIISCGLGEDASFDVEFASRFDARVVVVAPTPRAILHFEDIQRRLGDASLHSYVKGGKQPVTSYDLRNLRKSSLTLEPSALWVENTKLKFFAPENPNHVSHSIVNYQNKYDQAGAHIVVDASTLESILQRHHIATLPLLKLDIEGAEIDVIPDILRKGIFPRQLLVEYDEMTRPSARSKANVERVDRILRDAGYYCQYFDGRANFLYVVP